MSTVLVHLSLRTSTPLVTLVLRRAASAPFLVLAAGLALTVGAALAASIPIFTEAVLTARLREELLSPAEDRVVPRSSLLLAYLPGRGNPGLSPERYGIVDTALRAELAARVPLPVVRVVRAAQTEAMRLLPPEEADRVTPAESYVSVAWLDGMADEIELLEGRLPARGSSDLEAVISTEGLDELGLHVGDRVRLVPAGGPSALDLRVVGRWRARSPDGAYWFQRPDSLQSALLVPEQAFWEGVARQAPRSVREVTWYVLVDPGQVRVGDTNKLLASIEELRVSAEGVLRGLRLDLSPAELLESYRYRAFLLGVVLVVLSVPLMVLVLLVVGFAASLLADERRGEIALLKSRGATTGQVLGTFLAEGLGLVGAAVVLGPPLGLVLAEGMGWSESFLRFRPAGVLPARAGIEAWAAAAAAGVLGLGAFLLPAWRAARHSVVTQRQEEARQVRPPLWRRALLDLVPLPLAGYAFFLLTQRGSVLPVSGAGDAFSDPLMLLAPGLGLLAGGLLSLRLFPLLVLAVGSLVGPVLGVPGLLALRQLTRRSGEASGLVLALTLATGLGAFASSTAATLDRNLADATAYALGADVRLQEMGAYDEASGAWTLLPVDDHLAVAGVEAAVRVLRVSATEQLGTRPGGAQVMAVDPAEFSTVVHWRRDYGPEPLGRLMEQLAADPMAVLVDRRLLEARRLAVGDPLPVVFKGQPVEFTVAGWVDYMPSLFPERESFLVANLEYLFENLPPQPVEVWLKLSPGAEPSAVVKQLRAMDLPIVETETLQDHLERARKDATRSGAFGLLSVGFLSAALLSGVALLLHGHRAMRRRYPEWGILRAIGLSVGQLTALVLLETSFVVVGGAALGTALGLVVSSLFIPFLQVRQGLATGTPPLVTEAPWVGLVPLGMVLGVFLGAALLWDLAVVQRLRPAEAIKGGGDRG